MRILVTGANGFIGRHVVSALVRDHEVVSAVRRAGTAADTTREVVVGDIDGATNWTDALAGADVVIHLAARVHVMSESESDSLGAYREVNTFGARGLAEACVEEGIRRLVFVSSIKVNAEATNGVPISAIDVPMPVDPYGVSKLEAEEALRSVAANHDLEVIVLRPPVVYGIGVGGNIRRIASAVKRRLPLPFGSIHNRRTMIAVANLVTAVCAAATIRRVPDGPLLVGDPQPVSTAELVTHLAEGMGVRPRLIPFPVAGLRSLAAMVGRRSDAMRLTEDLEVTSNWTELGVKNDQLVDARHALAELGAEWRRD